MRVLVSSLSILAAAAVSSSRIVVPIDLGWRTAPFGGDNANCTFPNPSTCQIGGLNAAPSATNAVTCAAAACAIRATTWQYEASQGCWIGNGNACAYPLGSWIGASMTSVGPGPDPNAPEAQSNFNDAAWRIIDTPHDANIEGNYSKSANGGEGFLPPAVTWYRKHLAIPSTWAGQAITLTLDASLSTSTFWLNGKLLVSARPSGYLPLHIRLDGVNGLIIGGNNVFVAYVDGSETTGWWCVYINLLLSAAACYIRCSITHTQLPPFSLLFPSFFLSRYEGSGLLRHARLTVTNSDAYIAPSGVSSPSYISGAITPHNAADTSTGLFADVVLTPSVDILYLNPIKVTASFRLIAADGVTVVATSSVAGSKSTLQPTSMTLQGAELWSVPRPYLYTLETTVTGGSVDAVNTSVGLRGITFDAERGMFVNEQHVKMRGFCNHESFTGVGGALPDRVDLLRIQQMRGVGGNGLRTSHNPVHEIMLDIADRLGILVLDENRVLASQQDCVGLKCQNVPSYLGDPAADVGALALRDRNHASIFAYSLCNEAGCGDGSLLNNDTVIAAKQASYTYDGSRVVGANMGWLSPTTPRTPMSDALDLMGFSHASAQNIADFHDMEPAKPLMMSECCSCETQRGEDADEPYNKSSVYYSNLNADCLAHQVGVSDSQEYMSGTFVWTLHDYEVELNFRRKREKERERDAFLPPPPPSHSSSYRRTRSMAPREFFIRCYRSVRFYESGRVMVPRMVVIEHHSG